MLRLVHLKYAVATVEDALFIGVLLKNFWHYKRGVFMSPENCKYCTFFGICSLREEFKMLHRQLCKSGTLEVSVKCNGYQKKQYKGFFNSDWRPGFL